MINTKGFFQLTQRIEICKYYDKNKIIVYKLTNLKKKILENQFHHEKTKEIEYVTS